jgi:hypothetical protein
MRRGLDSAASGKGASTASKCCGKSAGSAPSLSSCPGCHCFCLLALRLVQQYGAQCRSATPWCGATSRPNRSYGRFGPLTLVMPMGALASRAVTAAVCGRRHDPRLRVVATGLASAAGACGASVGRKARTVSPGGETRRIGTSSRMGTKARFCRDVKLVRLLQRPTSCRITSLLSQSILPPSSTWRDDGSRSENNRGDPTTRDQRSRGSRDRVGPSP